MQRASRYQIHAGDFLSFTGLEESLRSVNDPYNTVSYLASPQLEPYVHDNLSNRIENT